MTRSEPATGGVALVTGGGRRVGQAIALSLAGAGYDLAVHYRSADEGARATVGRARSLGRTAKAYRANLGSERAIDAMMRRVRSDFGRLDLVVLSAAVFERRALEDLDAGSLDAMFSVNLRAPFLVARAALPLLAPGSQIIAITDVGARLAWPGFSHYCASKAGLEAMIRCLAVELAPRVRVNAVAPGTVLWAKGTPAAVRRRVLARIPLERVGSPEDIASTVAFLARGSDWITGQVFTVDGGRQVYCGGP